MKDAYNEILEYINTLDIIDTHEHLPCKEEARGQSILRSFELLDKKSNSYPWHRIIFS